MNKVRNAIFAPVSMLALALSSAAYASQEQAETAEDEVVVTAQKRAQRSIDVPISMTVMGDAELKERGIQDIQDLSLSVPGVVLRSEGPGSLQVFMRGSGNLAGQNPLVSVYMDEIPMTLGEAFRQLDVRTLDIARVEVLKGPQGTLYGQGAASGAIRFITHKPDLTRVSGSIEGELSFIDQGSSNEKLTGVINVPLVKDKLALRVAAALETGGGWIDQPEAGIRDGNNQDLSNINAKLLWQPSDNLEIQANVIRYENRSRFGLNYEDADRTNHLPGDPKREFPGRYDRFQVYNLTASLDIGFADIISSTSLTNLRRDYHLTYVSNPAITVYGVQNEGYDIINDKARQFAQELRLVSDGTGPLNYTLGFFYRDVSSTLVVQDGVNIYDGVTYPYTYSRDSASKSFSVFADVSYKLANRLEAGVGVRYFRDKARMREGTAPFESGTFTSVDPRFYLTYGLTDRWNVYANVSKGFRSGGFNLNGNPPFDPEELWNYEIGTKGSTADGRLHFEIAAFYTRYSNMLRRGLIYIDALHDFRNVISNIGRVDVKGVELGLTWKPVSRVRLSASGAFTDSEVKSLKLGNGGSSAVRIGDRSDYIPRFSFTLAADTDFNWSSAVEGFAHIDFNYRDKVYYTDSNIYLEPFRVQSSDAVGLLNARIGARWSGVTAELFAANIANANKALDPFWSWHQSNRTKPRTIGVKLGYSF